MGHSSSAQQETPLAERLSAAAGSRPVALFALGQWAKNFPASFPDEDSMVGKVRDWRDLLEHHPWVTADVFRRTVSLVRFTHHGPFVPELATLLDYCHEAQRQVQAEERKALPPPPSPPPGAWGRRSGPERAAFLERHIAIGKLKARAGHGVLSEWLPPEEDIAAVVAELRRTGQFRKTLDRIASGAPDPLRGVGQELGQKEAGAWRH